MGRILFDLPNAAACRRCCEAPDSTGVEEDTKTLPWTWLGPVEELWEYSQSVSVPFRPMLERVPAEKWAEIHAEVHAAVRRYSGGEEVVFGASVVLASGTK